MKTFYLIIILSITPLFSAVYAQDNTKTWQFDLRRAVAAPGNIEDGRNKAQLCSACHGNEGIAIVPIYPNLAGQSASYLYWNLQAYKIGRMPLSAMATLAQPLSEQDIRDLAAYYASLPSAPTGEDPRADFAADAAILAQGERIYLSGNVEKGIPPCQGCHGKAAEGHPQAHFVDRSGRLPFATVPALRGQQENYLQTRLQQYHDGLFNASTNSQTMNAVGQRLDAESIRAVSAWLAGLR